MLRLDVPASDSLTGLAPQNRLEKCGYFCGYTPSKRCEILGSTHSLRKFDGVCNALIMGDIEQFRAMLCGAIFQLLTEGL